MSQNRRACALPLPFDPVVYFRGSPYYPSRDNSEVIEIEFLKLDGEVRSLKLLVDSGFTGKSSFVLTDNALDLFRAEIQPANAVGALQGQQNRAWVTCRIPELSFQSTLIAIVADISSLSLPSEVEGMAGLTFLRQFARWGAEQSETGWQFLLSKGGN